MFLLQMGNASRPYLLNDATLTSIERIESKERSAIDTDTLSTQQLQRRREHKDKYKQQIENLGAILI